MKEEQKVNHEDNTSEPEPAADWFLQRLVVLANRGLGMPVTLNVGGSLISGSLTSGRNYFEGIAKEIAESVQPPDSEVSESLERFFLVGAEIYPDPDSGNETDEDAAEDSGFPGFIHLCDARVFHPGAGPVPANRGLFWRGRISKVDGFTMGCLEVG